MRRVLWLWRREWQLSARAPALWAVAVLAAFLSAWRASSEGTSAGLAAYQARQVVVWGMGCVAALVAGAAAGRDRRHRSLELILSKPVGVSPASPVVRWAGLLAAELAAAAVVLAAACVAQVVLAGSRFDPLPYVVAWAQAVSPMAAACALGFCLASAFTTPLAAGVGALYWATVPLARAHLPAALDLTLTQHWPLAAALSAFSVAAAAALYARKLRGKAPGGRRAGWTAAVAGVMLAAVVWRVLGSGEDALVAPDPVLMAMSAQSCLPGHRAPGFWLRDARGRLVALSDHQGKVIALAFWSPAVPESVRALATLEEAAREFRGRDIAFLAVCLDRDAGAMRLFAREVGPGVALLWDRGQHFGRGGEWSDSPVATCYEVDEVASVFLLDRERRYVDLLRGEPGLAHLRRSLWELLEGP